MRLNLRGVAVLQVNLRLLGSYESAINLSLGPLKTRPRTKRWCRQSRDGRNPGDQVLPHCSPKSTRNGQIKMRDKRDKSPPLRSPTRLRRFPMPRFLPALARLWPTRGWRGGLRRVRCDSWLRRRAPDAGRGPRRGWWRRRAGPTAGGTDGTELAHGGKAILLQLAGRPRPPPRRTSAAIRKSGYGISFDQTQRLPDGTFTKRQSLYIGECFFCQDTQNVARRHLKEKPEAQFFQNCCHVVPPNTVRNVTRQILRDGLRTPDCSARHIAEVHHLRRSQLHCLQTFF